MQVKKDDLHMLFCANMGAPVGMMRSSDSCGREQSARDPDKKKMIRRSRPKARPAPAGFGGVKEGGALFLLASGDEAKFVWEFS